MGHLHSRRSREESYAVFCDGWRAKREIPYPYNGDDTAFDDNVFGISGRRHLRSADRGHLDFPRVNLLRTEDVRLHTPAV